LTSLDISFDSRESLYFGITLPENGVLFENSEKLTPYFIGTLRGFAWICRFPYSSPDNEKFMVKPNLPIQQKKQYRVFYFRS